ncbi:phytoene desaturase family protein [Streptomyces hoynatensis]|uniref:NAD(P)/FAD-dependent oxidoreductase n=1 Tax=Streptomyces hoynatensis TaxID=1141874 RepID=A0A3A9Z1K6_9ACTN|nr:NAD(P)/FAD-dependent oxidoreductase [Streptomyces hoynatensis]RKN42291.1 NAD(P)/FAD-dependent oxidoreductase [Streptomyces hoynatensis]
MARIVVVGAGMGAMAAAARLATAGHRVTVVERGEGPGGALGRFAREGFAFDTGPGLLYLPAVWRDLFVKTGREELAERVPLARVDPAAEHRFADGVAVRLPAALGGVRQALDQALGAGAGERWAGLLGRAGAVWEAVRRPLVEEPLTGPPPPALARDPYPARPRGLLRRRPPGTLAEVAEAELRDPRLSALLVATAQEYGCPPGALPPGAALFAYLEQSFGLWYPRGGMRALAEAVYARCRERRVEFRFGVRATGVLSREGRAAGVELAGGEAFEADSVVWGAPPPGAPTPRGLSRFTLLLALRGPRPPGTAHRTLLHGAEAGAAVRVLRPDDPTLVPGPGHEAVVVSAPAPAQGEVDWTAPGPVREWTQRLLAATEAAGLGLRERLLWHEARTPADVAGDTGVPGGVVAPPALAGADGALLAAPNTGRLTGLYRVGALAHPGGGLAAVGMSGALAAGLIVEGPEWRGSS